MLMDSSDIIGNSNDSSHDSSLRQGAPSSFEDLLARAKGGDRDALGTLLQWYVNYLTILATSGLDQKLRRRVNPSDVVQEAMLEAHRDFGDFRGQTQPELLGWLRQILIHTLHRNFARHVKAEKRDVRREVSLDELSERLEESACNLATLLPSSVESPSASMQARERSVELANQLGKLPPSYRDVLVFRVLQGLSFEEIAERMERSGGAVRMLWLRALEAFRTQGDPGRDD